MPTLGHCLSPGQKRLVLRRESDPYPGPLCLGWPNQGHTNTGRVTSSALTAHSGSGHSTCVNGKLHSGYSESCGLYLYYHWSKTNALPLSLILHFRFWGDKLSKRCIQTPVSLSLPLFIKTQYRPRSLCMSSCQHQGSDTRLHLYGESGRTGSEVCNYAKNTMYGPV